MKIRLGFHYHIPIHHAADSLYLPGYLGRFLDALAQNCDELICFSHTPRADEIDKMDYLVKSANIQSVNIGPHDSVTRRTLRQKWIEGIIESYQEAMDVFLVRAPTPLLPTIARACRKLPVVLLLVGDYVEGIDNLAQPFWRKELIRLWARWNKQQQTRLARRSLTFVNSHKLFEELQPMVPSLVETRTTTLKVSDFYERVDTCQTPFHLLYTGRMDRGKGLADMVEALEILVRRGYDVCLDLVGWPEPGDTVVEEIKADAMGKGLQERVVYHGFKPLGEELFAYYKNADIYLIASRSSFEGFPRTIWEAMAHSVPVVATRVGSIPAFIEGASELVVPGKPAELADGIQRVIEKSESRKVMIERGMRLARQNTLDAQADQMVSEIEHWLVERR